MSYRKTYFLLVTLVLLGCFGALWYFDQPGFTGKHRMGTLLATALVIAGLTRHYFVGMRDDD
ncbi:hypothetical protein SAMN05444358_101397 [Ruegeria halocynthiae]|uniref:Uncharacterized protein n=1 Tax=Ruegeria halocynthiae TaxID=985054 RepID=A0A1H2S916_9RHOB|nr:hypothetical protein SAMN05444358_101397 [Ruegeria halocynthiae]